MQVKKLLKIIVPILFVIIFLLSVNFLKENSPNKNDNKLNEIYDKVADVAVYPDFVKVGEDNSSRYLDAGVYQYYRSSAKYESVRNFYLSSLSQKGWTYKQDDSDKLIFQKGDITLYIDYAPKSSDWNYGLSYVWRNNL